MQSQSLEVNNKAVLKIAVPMAAGFLTTPLVGLADTAIVGQLGNAAFIGGVGVAAILIGLLLTTFNFLRSATSALTAQAFGANDAKEQVAVLLRSSLIAVVAGGLVVVLHRPLLQLGLFLMNPSEAVSDVAADYFNVRILATPFALLNFVYLSWLVGTGRTMLCFVLQTALNVINILLTYYLVLVLDMGVAGAAWGTFVAEVLIAVVTFIILLPRINPYRTKVFELALNIAKLRSMMLLNTDIMIRSFCLQLAFAFFTRQSAQQSDTVLAANEVLLHFFMIAGYFLDGFAIAVEQFVGRAVGAKSKPTFEKSVRLTFLWNGGQAIVLSLVFFLFGILLIHFMTPNEEIRAVAETYMIWAALTPVIGVAAFQMDGVFIGATWSKDMRNSMIISLLVLIATYYIVFPFLGNHGLWFALSIFLSMRAISLYWLLGKRKQALFASF